MRKVIACSVFILLFFLGKSVWAANCGGDGPTPFQEVSFPHPQVKVIPVLGTVQDFLYREKGKALVYRNDFNQLRSYFLNYSVDRMLASLGIPLSRIVDEKENYVITHDGGWFLDTSKFSRWKKIFTDALDSEPLFWNNDSLFFLEDVRVGLLNKQLLSAYEYRVGGEWANWRCSYQASLGEKYFVGEGHLFPHVVLYRVVNTLKGPELSLYKMNVLNCEMSYVGNYVYHIQANIKKVVSLSSIYSYALITDNSSENLMLATENGCASFHMGEGEVIVPNPKKAVIATWSDEQGLSLFSLESLKKVTYFKGTDVRGLSQKDILLSGDKNQLFVTPRSPYHKWNWIIEINVDELFTSK